MLTYGFSTVGDGLLQRAHQPRSPLLAPRKAVGSSSRACTQAGVRRLTTGFRAPAVHCFNACTVAGMRPCCHLLLARSPRLRALGVGGGGSAPPQDPHQGSPSMPDSFAWAQRGGFAAQIANSQGV